jgi:hypothetical protein
MAGKYIVVDVAGGALRVGEVMPDGNVVAAIKVEDLSGCNGMTWAEGRRQARELAQRVASGLNWLDEMEAGIGDLPVPTEGDR